MFCLLTDVYIYIYMCIFVYISKDKLLDRASEISEFLRLKRVNSPIHATVPIPATVEQIYCPGHFTDPATYCPGQVKSDMVYILMRH